MNTFKQVFIDLYRDPLTRKHFIIRFVLTFILSLLLNVVIDTLDKIAYRLSGQLDLYFISLILAASLVLLIYTIGIFSRRFADLNESKWHCLWCLIPLVNIFFLIYLFSVPGALSKAEK
ncbi:DUF805 domain-containing protein [Sutterella wadsworthensis]|uniref:DUF805 domain-containing protein n=1 Tax=Sutterella wadsworthensis TaxID=40545 RepID=UPI0013F5E2E2